VEPERLHRILVTHGDPTTEMLALCMMSKLNAFLAADGGRLACTEIQIEETPTNKVTFDGNPANFLPTTAAGWWSRPDMSINDLHTTPAPRAAAMA
jgi:6-pyruvoyltetrahydropterin/6-carboxytetrahydropterin synthase